MVFFTRITRLRIRKRRCLRRFFFRQGGQQGLTTTQITFLAIFFALRLLLGFGFGFSLQEQL